MQSQLKEIEKIRHSVVTDDYIALDRIQNKNWQYLIESILEICKSDNSNEAIEIKKTKNRDSVEMSLFAKKHTKLCIIKLVKI